MGRISDALLLLWGLSLILSLILTPWMFWFAPTQTDYSYQVKAQQAFDVSRVDDSDVTEFENLSEDEQYVLYQAFKKSDHFMGTSEVYVSTDERMETFQGWRSVEVNGIVMVVAVVEHTEERTDFSEPWVWELSLLGIGSLTYFLAGVMVPMMAGPRY